MFCPKTVPDLYTGTWLSSKLSIWQRISLLQVLRLRTICASWDSRDVLGVYTGLLATESPLKMMKNTFSFTWKSFFVLNVFKFLSWLFGHVEERLHYKDKINFKLYNVTTWLTNNCSNIFPSISRSKGDQTKKGDQLIEYNMRNIFLEKLYMKCSRETIFRLFFKKLKLNISLDQ